MQAHARLACRLRPQHAGTPFAINVTAVDQYGNRWASGFPGFTTICPVCHSQGSKTNIESGNGRSDFVIVHNVASGPAKRNVDIYMPASAVLIKVALISILNADITAESSELDGPVSVVAGSSTVYRFTPRDEFGNIAVLNHTATPAVYSTYLAELLDEETRTVTWDLNATALAADPADPAFELMVAPVLAGTYMMRVKAGLEVQQVTPSLLHGPIVVEAGPVAATQTAIVVRL